MVFPFNRVWRKEKREHWKALRKKRKRKVRFILGKYDRLELLNCVSEFEGVIVGYQDIPDTFSSDPDAMEVYN